MNKYIVFAFLFAAVAAEDGYTCTDTDEIWNDFDLSDEAVTDAEGCKAACETDLAEGGDTLDACCEAVAVTEPASLTCTVWTTIAASLDIRAEANDEEGTTSSAWAWEAGVASADLTVVEESADDDEEATEEDDEDMSVRMTASALTAAASIAMIAM